LHQRKKKPYLSCSFFIWKTNWMCFATQKKVQKKLFVFLLSKKKKRFIFYYVKEELTPSSLKVSNTWTFKFLLNIKPLCFVFFTTFVLKWTNPHVTSHVLVSTCKLNWIF
jgi:hypothetical protein